jgi:hypothetical protein
MFKFKHFPTFVFMAVAILAGGTLAYGVQGPFGVNAAVNPNGSYSPMRVDSGKNLVVTETATATSSVLAVSGPAVALAQGSGTLLTINVITASGVGAVYDVALAASAATANQIGVIPATAGIYTYKFPFINGLVINPSSSVISVNYR